MIEIKVAIMGAGLSGLSCAITLEKNGIQPDIFEKRSEIGDRFVNCEILLSTLSKPINDAIRYFSENHKIYLKPQSNIKKLIIHSEKEQAEITGNLGYTNLRGRAENSFEKQLAEQVKSRINYNSKKTYEELLKEYTHVVLATGDAAYADQIQEYGIDLTITLKGALIEGEFNPYTVQAWLNNDMAPMGYCYLIPISHEKANIVIAYPEYSQTKKYNKDYLWENFIKDVSRKIDQEINQTTNFEINEYIIGLCNYPRIGNTFFVGNNFGSIMPFLGFGQVAALLTGIYAAHDICGKGDYEKLTQRLKNSFQNSLVLRRAMEKMDNSNYDFMVNRLKGSLGKRLFNGKFNYLKLLSKILNPFIDTSPISK